MPIVVSFYVLAAKWPYSVTTDIEVDGGIHVLVDMKDYDSDDVGSGLSTVPYSVVASWIGTTSAEHILRISVPENGEYAIVDGLMQVHAASSKSFKLTSFRFEAPDNDINVTTTSITSSSTATSTTSFSTSSTSDPSSSAAATSAKGGPSDSRSNSSSHSNHLGIIIGVISAVLAIILIFLVWWFCIRRRGRSNTRNEMDTPFTGGADSPPIDSNDQDGYDGYGYPSSPPPRTVQPAAAYPAVRRTRNRAGRVQSLAPSSRQDGLASVAHSVIGGRPPMGYA